MPSSAADGKRPGTGAALGPSLARDPHPAGGGREVWCPWPPVLAALSSTVLRRRFSQSAGAHGMGSPAAFQEGGWPVEQAVLDHGTSPNSSEGLCGSWRWWHPPPKGHGGGLLGTALAPFSLEGVSRGWDQIPHGPFCFTSPANLCHNSEPNQQEFGVDVFLARLECLLAPHLGNLAGGLGDLSED